MADWRNASGRPLSSLPWLEAHHRAKLAERTAFAKSLLKANPKKVVDLGCGPGIWLELLNSYLPPDCEFVGIDIDDTALEFARTKAASWSRPSRFEQLDIEADSCRVPDADIFLAFNIFPYLNDAPRFLNNLKRRVRSGGLVTVRQYDGDYLRFGPMTQGTRSSIDRALEAALLGSEQFRHYDLDRVFEILSSSDFRVQNIDFELFRRVSPYPPEFDEYFRNTIQWMMQYIGDDARVKLQCWYDAHARCTATPSYFTEIDLVAWLS